MTLSPLSSAFKILLNSKVEALLDSTLKGGGGGGWYSPINVTGVLVAPCRGLNWWIGVLKPKITAVRDETPY